MTSTERTTSAARKRKKGKRSRVGSNNEAKVALRGTP